MLERPIIPGTTPTTFSETLNPIHPSVFRSVTSSPAPADWTWKLDTVKLNQVMEVLHSINYTDLGQRISGHMHNDKPRKLVCRKKSQHNTRKQNKPMGEGARCPRGCLRASSGTHAPHLSLGIPKIAHVALLLSCSVVSNSFGPHGL